MSEMPVHMMDSVYWMSSIGSGFVKCHERSAVETTAFSSEDGGDRG